MDTALGTVAFTDDVLAKAQIGLWAIERDETDCPRMYMDEKARVLFDFSESLSAEETYALWYSGIAPDSRDIVEDVLARMSVSAPVELEFTWHAPNGGKSFCRFYGARNPNYAQGVRLEGTIRRSAPRSAPVLHRKQMMQETLDVQSIIMQYFLEPFESAYYIDLRDRSCWVLRRSDELANRYPVIGDYMVSFGEYIDAEVKKEDQSRLYQISAPEYIRERLAEVKEYAQTYRCHTDKGERVFRMTIIRGSDDDHACMSFIDITDDLQAERERQAQLEAALERAEIANKAKTAFLFNMSHDIRTPMNAIMGFTNMALKHIDDREKVIEVLQKTQESNRLLLSLVNDVLEMSRIESGKLNLETVEGDVNLSFSNIEPAMTMLAKEKNIDLSFAMQDVTDRYVYVDLTRCVRVFLNIISNAIKYTQPGGFVKVTGKQIGKKDGFGIYQYTIRDNGFGMSEEFQEHMFEDFAREEGDENVRGIQGTGLGLAVCKAFMDAMGGTISCESKKGVGTTFTLVIPFKLQEGHLYTDPVHGGVVSGAADAEETVCFKGRRVLVVEDNEMNRLIAEDILTDEGLRVEMAEDGSVAVNMLREKGPAYYDFVLMDIQMPVMNGYEATSAIRAMYPEAKLPIIALSANAFEEDRQASRAAGMDAHVAKPIVVNTLFETIAKVLRG